MDNTNPLAIAADLLADLAAETEESIAVGRSWMDGTLTEDEYKDAHWQMAECEVRLDRTHAALSLLETLAAYTVDVVDEAGDLSYARVSDGNRVCRMRSIERIGGRWKPAPSDLSYADAVAIIATLRECERRNKEATDG